MKSVGRFWSSCTLAWAFVRRDVLFETSYKLQSLVHLLGVFAQILIFYYLSKVLGDGQTDLQPYGGSYFSFVLVGIVFHNIFDATLLTQFTNALRLQLTLGVFEAMCATPLRPSHLMSYSLLWPMAGSLLKASIYLLLGATALGAELGITRFPVLLLTLGLCIVVFGSLAMIAGSLLLYFKRGDPVTWLLSTLVALVGGVFFPTNALPSWLEGVSRILPMPYALDALRIELIPSADPSELWEKHLALLVFAAILGPTAWLVTTKLFEVSRRQGGLGLH